MFNKRLISLLAMFIAVSWFAVTLEAQCPMCRMSAESNMQNGGTSGAGLNAGILYMLAAPYLIVGGIAFWWWKNKKKEEELGNEQELSAKLPGQDASLWN